VLVQGDDLFFDRVFGNQPVDRDGTLLPNAMGPIAGLVFYSGVPPGVHVNYVISGGEVESGAACLEADQKDIALPRLKGIDALSAFVGGGAAVEILVANLLLIEIGLNNP
jgi:hypothetical protein